MAEVWIVNQYAVTPDYPGGTRHYDLGLELAKQGFRVLIFASDATVWLRGERKVPKGRTYALEHMDGLDFVWVPAVTYTGNGPRRLMNLMSFGLNYLKAASSLRRQGAPDLIVGSSPSPFAALAAQFSSRLMHKPFVLELRDLWPQALLDMGVLTPYHPIAVSLSAIERYLCSRAAAAIVLTSGAREYLVRRALARNRISVIPNGVHLGHFVARASREEARRKYAFSKFTVVYTGAHGPANGLETVVRAAHQVYHPEVEFVLVGDGPEKPQLTRLVRREGITNVRFMEPIPKNEIPNLLLAADAGLLVLKPASAFSYGVSPNKLFDYMAAGLPVVCNVPGESSEIVQSSGAGVVCEPGDPVALAHTVLSLFERTHDQLREMGEAGREYLRRNHDRQVLGARLTSLLRDVLLR